MKPKRTQDRARFVREVSTRLYARSKVRFSNRIPYAGVVFDEQEVRQVVGAVYDSFKSGWFALGKKGDEFERRFGRYIGLRHCILTNSGSSANLLVVAAMSELKKFNQGDEVLTPATTFPTTVNPLLLYGLRPVLVDLELPSYTVSTEELRQASSAGTRGIMLPHLNGSASYMPDIAELVRENGWTLIEDCCDALGTLVRGEHVGTFGLASTFSFYGAHHLCMGEGGAVCTDDDDVAETIRSLRDWGRSLGKELFDTRRGRELVRVSGDSDLPEDYEARYSYVSRGFNLKPVDVQPAMGLAQLRKMGSFGKARRQNYRFLLAGLSKFERHLVLPRPVEGVDPNWFVFPIVIRKDAGFARKELVDFLEKAGIETRPILAGDITKQPAYQGVEFVRRTPLPNSDLVLRGGLFVGVYPGLTEAQLSRIVDTFGLFFRMRGIG